MPTPLTSTPRASHIPGTAFATTFLKTFRECPIKAWYTYWAPHPSGALGLESPTLSLPLAIGSATHAALAIYQTHAGDLDKAILAASHDLTKRADQDLQERASLEVEKLMTRYHEHWGGQVHDLLTTGSHPLVEHLLSHPVGYQDYTFVAILDTLIIEDDCTKILEHKTVDASRVNSQVNAAQTDIQLTGQLWLLSQRAPSLGIEPGPHSLILNILIKRAGKDSQPCLRVPITRSQAELDKFRLDVAHTLSQADEMLETCLSLSAQGMRPLEAARQAFPLHGDLHCSFCSYRELCMFPENAENFFSLFSPRKEKGA